MAPIEPRWKNFLTFAGEAVGTNHFFDLGLTLGLVSVGTCNTEGKGQLARAKLARAEAMECRCRAEKAPTLQVSHQNSGLLNGQTNLVCQKCFQVILLRLAIFRDKQREISRCASEASKGMKAWPLKKDQTFEISSYSTYRTSKSQSFSCCEWPVGIQFIPVSPW